MARLRSFLSSLRPTRLGVLFAVLAGLGVGFWQWGQPPQPRVVIEYFGSPFSGDPQPHFSPDGRNLVTYQATDADSFVVTLWDARTGKKKSDLLQKKPTMAVIGGHVIGQEGFVIPQIVFSPDGQTLAGNFLKCSGDGLGKVLENKIRIWDVSRGKELATLNLEIAQEFDIEQMVFSQEGKLLVLKGEILLNVAENKIAKKLLHDGEIVARGDNTILVRSEAGLFKLWNLATATLVVEHQAPGKWKDRIVRSRLISDRYVLVQCDQADKGFVVDVVTGQEHEVSEIPKGITPDGRTVAFQERGPGHKSWWTELLEWLGIEQDSPDYAPITLNEFPSGKEIVSLNGCMGLTFSPDGKSLAVTCSDHSLQLWDLPIRKPIGKILGLAGLAALATLLAFKGLGWLRRRRSSPAPSGSSQHHEVQYVTADKKSGENHLP